MTESATLSPGLVDFVDRLRKAALALDLDV